MLASLVSGVVAWAMGAIQLGAAPPPPPLPPVRRIVVHEEVVWRIPVAPQRVSPVRWVEGKGPRCIRTDALAGAMLSGDDQVDFVLRDRRRVRARLDSRCPALDFYGGFYIAPDDGRLCARRDVIASRMGGDCRIARFRSLSPRAR